MKKLRFLVATFEKYMKKFLKKCQNCELYMTVNMSKVALILNNLRTASHPCWNCGPSNLFRFSDSCMGHLNKTQTETAVMLTLPTLKSYTNVKTLLKVSRILADPPKSGGPLKFLQNSRKMLFYLLIFFNIISFKYLF